VVYNYSNYMRVKFKLEVSDVTVTKLNAKYLKFFSTSPKHKRLCHCQSEARMTWRCFASSIYFLSLWILNFKT
jgi:hypothetical protein